MTVETLRDIANYLLVGGLFLAALGTGGVNLFRARVERDKEEAVRGKEQQRLDKERELNSKIEALLKGNQTLQDRVAPFEILARARYPQAEPNEALRRLEHDLESIKARTAGIEARAEPRRIPKSARSNVIMTLRAYAGHRVRLSVPNGDSEAFEFASQITALLREAGLNAGPINSVISTVPIRGIRLAVESEAPGSFGAAILTALHLCGIDVSGHADPSRITANEAYLDVGSKQ